MRHMIVLLILALCILAFVFSCDNSMNMSGGDVGGTEDDSSDDDDGGSDPETGIWDTSTFGNAKFGA